MKKVEVIFALCAPDVVAKKGSYSERTDIQMGCFAVS